MSKDAKSSEKRIDQFISGPGGRADDWRDLVEAAKAWARGGDRAKLDAALTDLSVIEEFHGYPGLQLMAALRKRRRSEMRRVHLVLRHASPRP